MVQAVADASALIALDQISQLSLLERVFGEVAIPPAVAREVQPGQRLPAWVKVRTLQGPLDERVAAASLDSGESQVFELEADDTLEATRRRLKASGRLGQEEREV